jgi:hypothetical protein
MRIVALAVALALSARAAAHIVPVPPSTCAFEPVSLDMPATGVAATVTPAVAADAFQILYDPQASAAQFNLTGVPPRSFAAGDVAGTLALSSLFGAALRNDGDLTATPTFTFTTGAGDASVPIALTTGLAVAGDGIVEGAPIAADGTFALVGVADPSPLPPPLAGGPLVVRLGCQAVPRPDTDQFRIATRTTPVSASLTAKLLKARLIFAPGSGDTPDFAGRPALLRVSAGGATVTTADLAGGLPKHGASFVGHTADGRAALGVRRLHRGGQVVYLLALKMKTPALPATATSPVSVQYTYDVGGLLSRLVLPMKAKRRGALLRYP